MDYMKDLENLCGVLSDQLSDVARKAKNGMSTGDLDTIEKLTHSLASVKKIMRIMEEDDGYSGRGYSMGYHDGGLARGGSYARGRGQRRDSMGRYSGEYGYSRNDLADKMRELMESAPDDRTRQEMQRMVDKLEHT
jgi:hypothetical protein